MIIKEIGKSGGFQVVKESDEWRIAHHTYKAGINSVKDFSKWGIHPDSEEMFILIRGNMLLATSGSLKSPEKMVIHKVEKETLYFVEKGERHAIVLEEDSIVLIVENRDMSNFIEISMSEEEKTKILEFMQK